MLTGKNTKAKNHPNARKSLREIERLERNLHAPAKKQCLITERARKQKENDQTMLVRVALGLEVGVAQSRRLYDLDLLLLIVRPLRRESRLCLRGSSGNIMITTRIYRKFDCKN